MEINKQSPVPLYEQVKQILINRILTGEYGPEEKIPSEKQLCLELGVSRPTIRQAVQELMAESRLYIKKGRGTYVRKTQRAAFIQDFSPYTFSFLQADTLEEDTLLHIGQVSDLPDSHTSAEKEGGGQTPYLLKPEAPTDRKPQAPSGRMTEGPFWELIRLKSIDRMPYAYIRAYIPTSMFPFLKEQLDAGLNMLAITANKYPFLPHRSDLNLSLSAAESDVSMHLNCSPGEPLFDLVASLYARSGGLCEHYRALVRSDLIHFLWKKDLR